MEIFRSFVGAVRVELVSADGGFFIRRLNEQGIAVSDFCALDELTLRFTVSRRDSAAVMNLAEKKGEDLRILSHYGIIWKLLSLRRRPVLLTGLMLLLLLCFFLPSRVLFVTVEGNGTVPSNRILEAAQESGVCFGASRRSVRSEKVKNRLLEELPQLQWAGVNTYGCRAVISVKERVAAQADSKPICSNVIAACDGVITSCTVTGGTGFCSAGQAVREGQTLISGSVDSGGLLVSGRAEGEIFAETRRSFSLLMPAATQKRRTTGGRHLNISLQFGKKRINFYKYSGISDTSCVKMIRQYHLTLPGGYQLPISLIVELTEESAVETGIYPEESLHTQLSVYARDYLEDHTIALTVKASEEHIASDGKIYEFIGQYRCVEMIGREQIEQIGDFDGKAN